MARAVADWKSLVNRKTVAFADSLENEIKGVLERLERPERSHRIAGWGPEKSGEVHAGIRL